MILYGEFWIYESTHPIYASLDHPLFACGGKRVEKIIIKLLFFLKLPLSSEAEERDVERSGDRVSCNRRFRQNYNSASTSCSGTPASALPLASHQPGRNAIRKEVESFMGKRLNESGQTKAATKNGQKSRACSRQRVTNPMLVMIRQIGK